MKDDYWIAKIDQVKKELKIDSDAKLAANLGISRQSIQKLRAGDIELSAENKAKIWDRLGYLHTRNRALLLLPKSVAEFVRNLDNERGRKIAEEAYAKRVREMEDALLDYRFLAASPEEFKQLVIEAADRVLLRDKEGTDGFWS